MNSIHFLNMPYNKLEKKWQNRKELARLDLDTGPRIPKHNVTFI